MQFVVTALDYTDADALNRRMAVREQHLAAIRTLIAERVWTCMGADRNKAGEAGATQITSMSDIRQDLSE